MGDNESVMQFSNRVLQLASTLKSMDVTVDESETSMTLLNGLPEEYAPLYYSNGYHEWSRTKCLSSTTASLV